MDLTRRSFLKGAASLAVVSAASALLSGCGTSPITTDTASIVGSSSGTLSYSGVGDVTLTATSARTFSAWNETLVLFLTVKNGLDKNPVTITTSPTSLGYNLVPSVRIDGKEAPKVKLSDVTYPTTAAGATLNTALQFSPLPSDWKTAEITISLYQGTVIAPKVTPVTFTINR